MAGRYKAYPEYKDSGIEWLGKIPNHWMIKKLKHLGKVIIGLTYSPTEVVDEGAGRLVLRSSNIQNKKLSFENNVYVKKIIPDKLVTKKGDILICTRNGSKALIGKNVKIHGKATGFTFGAFMTVFRGPFNDYLEKVFNSTLFDYQSGTFLTATINQLTSGNLNSFETPLPNYDERKAIANFLDHETAKIDKLIEKQQQLIKLLEEKRQAVISHAVTKGLNPNAPMKDSGIEWLGEVPEHWTISFIKYIISPAKNSMVDGPFGSSVNTEQDYDIQGIPVVRTVNITNMGFVYENLKFMKPSKFIKLKRHAVYPGDVLFSKVGTIGNACVLPDNVDEAILSTTGSCKITVNKDKLEADFLVFCIQLMHEALMQIANSNVQPFLNMSNIKNLSLPVPPVNEQKEILQRLRIDSGKLKKIISKASKAKALLQERRTALISAAVTGKIDVRDWKSPEAREAINE